MKYANYSGKNHIALPDSVTKEVDCADSLYINLHILDVTVNHVIYQSESNMRFEEAIKIDQLHLFLSLF